MKSILLFSLVTFSCLSSAFGDMGAITPIAGIALEETGQRAIIAYNGTDEILILGTDFTATASTMALRFIPLPTMPKVTLAPKEYFKKLAGIIKKYNLKYLKYSKLGKATTVHEGIELLFHDKIGAHDINIARITNTGHFEVWMNAFLDQKELPKRNLSKNEKRLIEDYTDRGFHYFVFDIVDIGTKTKSIEPLCYKFKSNKLYYPLKTSNLFKNNGTIELFIFSNKAELLDRVCNFWPKCTDGNATATVSVLREDVKQLSEQIVEIMENRIFLRVFKYKGNYSFKEDLLIKMESPVKELEIKE